MVCPCCQQLCYPCDECDWPEAVSETVSYDPCFGLVNNQSSRQQSYGATLPAGVTWKDGFPGRIESCNWRLVDDELVVTCCGEDCTVNGVPNQQEAFTKVRHRYRVLAIVCPTEEDPATVVDLTSQAIEGDLETEVQFGGDCVDEPVCSPWLDYYGDPTPVCNEFP